MLFPLRSLVVALVALLAFVESTKAAFCNHDMTEVDTSHLGAFTSISTGILCSRIGSLVNYHQLAFVIVEVADTQPLKIAMTPPDVVTPVVDNGELIFCPNSYQEGVAAGYVKYCDHIMGTASSNLTLSLFPRFLPRSVEVMVPTRMLAQLNIDGSGSPVYFTQLTPTGIDISGSGSSSVTLVGDASDMTSSTVTASVNGAHNDVTIHAPKTAITVNGNDNDVALKTPKVESMMVNGADNLIAVQGRCREYIVGCTENCNGI